MVIPPREGKHPGPRTTSIRRIGSQNETLIPILGIIPSKQIQKGGKGDTVFVSSPIGTTGIPPIFIGNIPSQSTSVMGLNSLPPHVTSPNEGVEIAKQAIRSNKIGTLHLILTYLHLWLRKIYV